jgi:type II secretory pathway pseudopilin PulG
MLAELIIAAIITGVVALVAGPGLSAVLRQQEQRRFEALAKLELRNLEGVAAANAVLGQWFQQRYPDAVLVREAAAELDELLPLGGAVRLTIRRPAVSGLPAQTVSLVIWPAGAEVAK